MSGELVHLEPWLDKAGLAARLECTPSDVDKFVRDGVPHVRLTRMRRFRLSEVQAWLERQRQRAADLEPCPHWLYRIYDDAGELLYVGMTKSRLRRFKEHGRAQSWWHQVARIDIQHFGNRHDCALAELRAIRQESPKFNSAGVR